MALLCACGGGGGGSSPAPAASTPAPTATPTVSYPASSNASATAGTSSTTTTLAAITGDYSAGVTLPVATAGSATANFILSATNGVALASSARLPRAIGGSLDPLAYILVTFSANVTLPSFPTFSFTVPPGFTLPAGAQLYLGYNAGDAAGNWSTLAGPATLSGTTVTFPGAAGPIMFTSGTTYAFSFFATGQALVPATPSPSPSPSASPSASPTSTASGTTNSAFTCPSSDTPAYVARTGSEQSAHRAPLRFGEVAASSVTRLAITYSHSALASGLPQVVARENAAGATFLRAIDFPNSTIRVVSVPSNQAVQVEATLRATAGVQSVGITGQRRFRTTTTAITTSDPYFQGDPPGNVGPYYETATLPGQWDMHIVGLGNAFGYSQAGTGYTPNSSALGSSSIKIAIIDTGEDPNHPELASKIVQQHCFITNEAGTSQSTGNFTVDEDGHGTDVSGIAAAATNNGLGFAGTGGNTSILAYRVFPTPDNNCADDGSSDAQCSADTTDIAAAINDAVTRGANVISMSLGGTPGCDSNGNDDDATEGAAVANAIAHNVIVVAAAGNSNSGSPVLDAPACDTGVIAVGATSLDDGQPTGTSSYTTPRTAGATASAPVEYVASYSQFGSTNTLRSSASWGIVAPGGDPANAETTTNGTVDYLHWIENIWTTTPYGGQTNAAFAGNCEPDFDASIGTDDCRTLIAGTSMATPHVAGAAALILAVNPSYQSPAAMKQLLCSTADNLGDTHQGCGRLNVYTAMATAIGDTSPPMPMP